MAISQLISGLINYLLSIVNSLGYLGIFIWMAIESTIIPLPAELVLLPAGVSASHGTLSIPLVVFASALGSLLGSLISYFVAYYLGRKIIIGRYNGFLFLKKESLAGADSYFKSHGEITIFLGRLFPVVRHLISLPAGFAKMNIGKFSLYTFLGSLVWSSIVVYFGLFYGIAVAKQNLNLALLWLAILGIIFITLYIIAHKRISRKASFL